MSGGRADSLDIVNGLCREGFDPLHVMEVGAYEAETVHSKQFIEAGVRVELVEPQASAIASIRAAYGHRPNVVLHPVAISDEAGFVMLASRGASSHTVSLCEAPVGSTDAADDAACEKVRAVTFDSIDDGTIDLLFCDVEGSEWKVLSRMKSIPRVIVVETHGHRYINPHLTDIIFWALRRGYRLIGHDVADTVWWRGPSAHVTLRRSGLAWLCWMAYLLRIHARRLIQGRSSHVGGTRR